MKKTLISLTGRHIENQTIKSVFKAIKNYPDSALEIADGYGIASNRNLLANMAIDEGFEYLLFVDNDIILPDNALNILFECLERTNSSVASGWYTLSQMPGFKLSVAHYNLDKNCYDAYTPEEWGYDPNDSSNVYVQIDANGLGLTLIKTDLFKKLTYPYFNYVEYENRSVLSEDLYFFDKLKQINEPCYAVKSLKAAHLKQLIL